MNNRSAGQGGSVRWGDVLFSAVAAVSWSLIGMAGTAALGLHLLEADSAGELGPMTAALVALGAGGSVTPSGDVSVFGLEGARATTAIEITPLGVGLVGALLLAWLFLRSLRGAGVVVTAAELLARVGTVVVLFAALMGGLAYAGQTMITLDGGDLGLDELPGGGDLGGVGIPGLGDIGDLGGGLLPDRLGDLVGADARVGFTVDAAPTVLGSLLWCLGVLLVALLASRRTPLPRGLDAVHRVVRPAVSAVVAVLLVAVAAGLAAAAYAAVGDPHPRRIVGAALLGAPNGVWLGVPLGLFVPWDGRATGALANLLPDPLDALLRVDADEPVTLGRLAELDSRVWLLGVAAALMMLCAGALTAVRTPFAGRGSPPAGGGADGAGARGGGALGFAGRCALRLGAATAVALPLLVLLTEVSVDASLAVLGIDAFDAGIELHGRTATALVLGAVWGAGAGAAGALLACATGAAGRRAAPLALGAVGPAPAAGASASAGSPSGPYTPGTPYRPPNPDTNPYLRVPEGLLRPGQDGEAGGAGAAGAERGGGSRRGAAGEDRGAGSERQVAGEDRGAGRGGGPGPEGRRPPDVYDAPTVARRFTQPPRRPGQRPGPGAGSGAGSGSGSGSGAGGGSGAGAGRWPAPPPPPDEGPPPPPPPPPPSPAPPGPGPRGR
ncbi:streptophobe family protein [Streptomyces heilongjiangensis]|uniref:Streptophobe family protein n=1 Tax=Streptomyces heilongjiangensis TaxID=945052 RepID=A0ABW1B2D1_9ACTN|nr:streptophobe family protein [Streptomyces heilongjiangensis]MDC2950929.1 streptophobe family protein [Streptomyces heilongjiangensis]